MINNLLCWYVVYVHVVNLQCVISFMLSSFFIIVVYNWGCAINQNSVLISASNVYENTVIAIK